MPSRRALLRTCAAGLTLGVAGCLGSGGESGPETETIATETAVTETARTTTETTATTSVPPSVAEIDPSAISDRGVPTAPMVESTVEEPFRAFAVGDRSGVSNPDDNLPHPFWVWNDTDDERTVELALSTHDATLLDESIEFPVRAALGIELREPRPYELTVREGDREKTVGVERSRFDCNRSATDVVVGASEIETSAITTDMACSTATASEET